MTAVTQADRPKSVRNRCVIEIFGGVFFYVVTMLFGFFSVSVGAFVIGLIQISSFLSYLVESWITVTSSKTCFGLAADYSVG